MLVKKKMLDIPADLWAEIERIAKRDHGGVTSRTIIQMIRQSVETDQKSKRK